MSRTASFSILLAALVVAPPLASAGTSVGVSVAIGNSPPPVIVLRQEPRLMVVPGSTVCVVQEDCGYDLFLYGVYWYAFNDGNWYRSRTHGGPYRLVRQRLVPSAIVNVPARYWRHAPKHPPRTMMREDPVAADVSHGHGHKH
jgi:hypothetical protein